MELILFCTPELENKNNKQKNLVGSLANSENSIKYFSLGEWYH